MTASIDQQFVEYIVKSLVSDPDAVKVERSIDEKGVLLALTVAPDDLGRVIGKRGNTAQSIRTLLRALGTKNDARYNLKIVDVNGGGDRRERPMQEGEAAAAVPSDTPTDAPADTPADVPADDSAGASQWAHLASTDDQAADDKTDEPDENDDQESTETSTASSSVVEKTRKELEELSDLNI